MAKKKAQPKRQRKARGGAPVGQGQGARVEPQMPGVRIRLPNSEIIINIPEDVRQNL